MSLHEIQMRIFGISFLFFMVGCIMLFIPQLDKPEFNLFGYTMNIPILIVCISAFTMIGSTCGIVMLFGIITMIFPNSFEQPSSREAKE